MNITDNYLAKLAHSGKQAPNFATLALVSLLLAAKINEPVMPNFANMVILAKILTPQNAPTLNDLTTMERLVLTGLEFNLQTEIVSNFIERFLQLLHLDHGCTKASREGD